MPRQGERVLGVKDEHVKGLSRHYHNFWRITCDEDEGFPACILTSAIAGALSDDSRASAAPPPSLCFAKSGSFQGKCGSFPCSISGLCKVTKGAEPAHTQVACNSV